jgi:hypothetical protein
MIGDCNCGIECLLKIMSILKSYYSFQNVDFRYGIYLILSYSINIIPILLIFIGMALFQLLFIAFLVISTQTQNDCM